MALLKQMDILVSIRMKFIEVVEYDNMPLKRIWENPHGPDWSEIVQCVSKNTVDSDEPLLVLMMKH